MLAELGKVNIAPGVMVISELTVPIPQLGASAPRNLKTTEQGEVFLTITFPAWAFAPKQSEIKIDKISNCFILIV